MYAFTSDVRCPVPAVEPDRLVVLDQKADAFFRAGSTALVFSPYSYRPVLRKQCSSNGTWLDTPLNVTGDRCGNGLAMGKVSFIMHAQCAKKP